TVPLVPEPGLFGELTGSTLRPLKKPANVTAYTLKSHATPGAIVGAPGALALARMATTSRESDGRCGRTHRHERGPHHPHARVQRARDSRGGDRRCPDGRATGADPAARDRRRRIDRWDAGSALRGYVAEERRGRVPRTEPRQGRRGA